MLPAFSPTRQSRAEFMIVDLPALDPELHRELAADAVVSITFETAGGEFARRTLRHRHRDVQAVASRSR